MAIIMTTDIQRILRTCCARPSIEIEQLLYDAVAEGALAQIRYDLKRRLERPIELIVRGGGWYRVAGTLLRDTPKHIYGSM